MSKPTLFIGSSVEQRNLALFIQTSLQYDASPIVWTQGTFEPSHFPLESLENALDVADFAVLVCAPEDLTTSRGQQAATVRDNVIFELGLFIGRLGRKRTFLISPRGQEFHLPTDLGGLSPETFDPDQLTNPEAALGPACTKILMAMRKLGPLPRKEEMNATEAEDERKSDRETSPKASALPSPNWAEKDFEWQYLLAAIRADDAQTAVIDTAFRKSSLAASAEAIAQWEAWQQLTQMMVGKKANLRLLREKAEAFPDNPRLRDFLARGLQHYGDEEGANDSFLEAMRLSRDMAVAAPVARRALTLAARRGDTSLAIRLRELLITLPRTSMDDEIEFTSALQEVARSAGLESLVRSIGEVVLILSPDDTSSRFDLAREYAESGHHHLSMYHYEMIPRDERTEAIWNNLGVSYARLQMNGKAVTAYETSAQSGGVIAVSNLAHKLMAAGFFDQALARANAVISSDEYRDNILEALTAIHEAQTSEAEAHSAAREKAKEQQQLRTAIGKASLESSGPEIDGTWNTHLGPILLKGDHDGHYVGSGEITREVTTPGLGGFFDAGPRRETSKISVALTRFGNAFEGTITIEATDRALTILGSIDRVRSIFLMVSDEGFRMDGIETGYEDSTFTWQRKKVQTIQ